jgi:hypothetical protein
MTVKFCLVLFLLAFGAVSTAQDRQPGNQTPSQIPRTVYVGDRAMLVLPLPEHNISADIEIDPRLYSAGFIEPQRENIELHRITLETRSSNRRLSGNRLSGNRLVIEFTAFAPGRFELPPIEIEGMRFSGLYLDISSVLAADELPVLSAFAPPLSVPGTGFLVFGSMTVIVLLLLVGLWVRIWGWLYVKRWFSAWMKRRLIFLMAKCEKRMRKALRSGKSCRFILDSVSAEFRNFLSLFTGINCRAMTPAEFEQFPVCSAGLPPDWDSDFLKRFFWRCDKLRFAGLEIASSDIYALLGELREYLFGLYRLTRGAGAAERQVV